MACLGGFGVALVTACGTSNPSPGFDNTSTSSNSTGNSTHVTTITQTSTSTLADGGIVVTTHTSTSTETVSNTSTSHSGTGSSSTNNGSSTPSSSASSSSSGSSSIADAGGDAAIVCSNTDMSILPIDAGGYVYSQCNSYGIQGSWYCYADTAGTSSCTKGSLPYSTSSSTPGMCISGQTSNSSSAYGAALGLALNDAKADTAGTAKSALSDASIVGFAITLSGSSGGMPLYVKYTTSGSDNLPPYVTVPAINGTVTYNVLFSDAVVSSSGRGKRVGSSVYDVQVTIPAPSNAAYNFCITQIKPITSKPSSNCTGTSDIGAPVCASTQFYFEETGTYGVQNNPINGVNGECVQLTCGGFKATYPSGYSASGSVPGSYPSMVDGWASGNMYGPYGGATSFSSATGVSSTWSWSESGLTNWDAAYDIWFGPSASMYQVNTGGFVELMIWQSHGGNWNPAGSQASSGSPVTINSTSYNVWINPNMTDGTNTWTYIAYVPSNTGSSGTFNGSLSAFFTDAQKHVSSMSGMNLLGIQAGFEVQSANNGTASTTAFSVSGL